MNELQTKKRSELLGGGILILLGLLFLLAQWLPDNLELFVPLTIGVLLLGWGIVARHAGPIIPGGILTGIGTGILLVERIFPNANDAIFLLGFGAGWVLITVATALFTDETHWWALIVAAIMLFIGAAATWGGVLLTLLSWAGSLWPLALILVGVYVIIRQIAAQK